MCTMGTTAVDSCANESSANVSMFVCGVLTCGQAHVQYQHCQIPVSPVCAQTHRHAAGRSSCELLGGS